MQPISMMSACEEKWFADQDKKSPKVLYDGTPTTTREIFRAVLEGRARRISKTVLEYDREGNPNLMVNMVGVMLDGRDFDEREEIPNGGALFSEPERAQKRAVFLAAHRARRLGIEPG